MERLRRLSSSPEPIKWLFTGDSITLGALHTYGHRDYTQLFAEHVRYVLARRRDIFINTAVDGCSSQDVLEDFDWRVGKLSPDVVFIMLGMNDCATNRTVSPEQFRSNLGHITSQSQALNGCEVILQTTCPVIAESALERALTLANYMEIVREVAIEQKVILIDHAKYWEAQIAENPLRRTSWMDDAVHPNAQGHRTFAELLFKQLNLLTAGKA